MFEKVNPYHPDKVADRVAGAIVDIAYTRAEGGWAKSNPRIAVEVLLGHGRAMVIIETSLSRHELCTEDVRDVLLRLCPEVPVERQHIIIAEQDQHLSENQQHGLRCGDNGIFKGCPLTHSQAVLLRVARELTEKHPSDGKYLIHDGKVVICQSNVSDQQAIEIKKWLLDNRIESVINPLGAWTGGIDVDCGCTNRKLGSDMGNAITGGGLHGKDLSKADVSVNILCHMEAQRTKNDVEACCAIGDDAVELIYADGSTKRMAFADVVEQARLYILTQHGSFENFAAWGLIA